MKKILLFDIDGTLLLTGGCGKIALERAFLDFFEFGGFGSDSRERSEIVRTTINRAEKLLGRKTSKKYIFVIGDTHHDVRAANKLGLKAIAVTTGSYAADRFLNGDQPTHLLENLTDSENFINLID